MPRHKICNALAGVTKTFIGIEPFGDAAARIEFTSFCGGAPNYRDCRRVHAWQDTSGTIWLSIEKHPSGYVLRFPSLADFTLSLDGGAICSYPAPGLPPETLQHLLLDQVLPLALSRQGKLVLHASAVRTPAGAVAFVGPSGQGKSTLSAFMAKHGMPAITDDCLLIEEKAGCLVCYPGYPGLRLWDDSVAALFGTDAVTTRVAGSPEKKRVTPCGGEPESLHGPIPLRRLYFLSPDRGSTERESITIAPLPFREALVSMVSCAFKLDITDKQVLKEEFYLLGRLVSQPLFYRLSFPRGYALLPDVRDRILEHVHGD